MLDWRRPQDHWLDLHRKFPICSSAWSAQQKLLHFHPHNMTVVHNLYNTDHKARLNFVNRLFFMWCILEKQTLHSFYLAVKLGFILVDMRTLRIMVFHQFTNGQYAIVGYFCGEVYVLLELLWSFFSETIIHTNMLHTNSDTTFSTPVVFQFNLHLCSTSQYNGSHCKQFCAVSSVLGDSIIHRDFGLIIHPIWIHAIFSYRIC